MITALTMLLAALLFAQNAAAPPPPPMTVDKIANDFYVVRGEGGGVAVVVGVGLGLVRVRAVVPVRTGATSSRESSTFVTGVPTVSRETT